MSALIPATEPSVLVAGDLIAWTKSLSDFSATDGYTLTYSLRLQNGSGLLDVTATASGSDFAISIPGASSNVMKAGLWNWAAVVTKASERYTVGAGTLEVQTNLATITHAVDLRTTAKTAVDNWEAIWAGIHSPAKSYMLNGREWTSQDISEIVIGLQQARADYKAEQQAAEFARTGINPRRIGVRFTRV